METQNDQLNCSQTLKAKNLNIWLLDKHEEKIRRHVFLFPQQKGAKE
jgi:hypothetical protein